MLERIKKCAQDIKVYIIVSFIVLLGLIFSFELWNINIAEVPLYYECDASWNIVRQQILIEEDGLGYSASRMGFPLGHESYDFTTGSLIPLLWQKGWALITDNPILGLNLSYMFGFFLIAWVAVRILMKLGIDESIAAVLSVLYAFLPYHMWRGTMHNALSLYFVVPIAVYCVLRLMEVQEQTHKAGRKQIITWIILMLLVGMDGVYYAFFSCVFLGVALLYNLINKRSVKNIIGCVLSIMLIVMGVVVSVLPSIFYWIKYGTAIESIIRSMKDVSTYALKIAQLILPAHNHRISLFSDINERYSEIGGLNETVSVALGLVFTIGYLALWVSILKKEKKEQRSIWHSLVVLTICGTIYATAGGLIEMQGFLTTLIRCSNRICVFLAFFACIAVALMLQNLWVKKGMTNKRSVGLLLLCLVCFGIFDQTPRLNTEAYNESKANIANIRNLVNEIENTESDIAILQLPYAVFPESGKIEQMKDYSHALFYAFSDNLKWSYGAMRGRAADALLSNLSQLDTPDMVEQAAKIGFGGIVIDRYGYSGAAVVQLEQELLEITKQEPVVSPDERYAFYSLKQYITDYSIEYHPGEIDDTLLYKISNGKNMYPQEKNDTDQWFWAQNQSELKIMNYTDEVQTKIFTCNLVYYNPNAQNPIYAEWGKTIDEIAIAQGGITYTKVLTLEPGENIIKFSSEETNEEIDGGVRQICFMISNYRLLEE